MECIISQCKRSAGTEHYPENLQPAGEPCQHREQSWLELHLVCVPGLCELQFWPGYQGSPPAAGHSLQQGGCQPLMDPSPSKVPGMTA